MAGEKTEKATAKRKEDERKKGNVFLSKEIVTIASLFTAFLCLKIFFPLIMNTCQDAISSFISRAATQVDVTQEDLGRLFIDACVMFAKTALPLLLIGGLVTIVVTMAQTKLLFSPKAFQFKGERINPISGMKKLFSMRSFVELLKSIMKITVLLVIVYTILEDELYTLPRLMDMQPIQAMAFTGDLILQIALQVGIIFVFLAAGDYLYQWWEYEKNLRMSKQEIKDEYKQIEGDPQVKGHIRQLQQQRARNRMMQGVPEADVVIRNPTHYAVAIRYEQGKHRAPVVIAKGADVIALRIIEVAEEANVYIMENRPLARAMFETVDIDSEIPEEFYQAVAEVLAFVYGINKKGLN